MADDLTPEQKAAQKAIRDEAIEAVPAEDAGEFTMRILVEGERTIDNRFFDEGVVGWRQPPLSLMGLSENKKDGHGGSVAVGTITKIWRDGTEIWGSGHFSSSEIGQSYRAMAREGTINGISADVGGAQSEVFADDDGNKVQRIKTGTITGVTMLPFQAFEEGRIAVTAGAGPSRPPKFWFDNPGLSEPTAITVTDEGQVFGHLAQWGSCHLGYSDRCVTVPSSPSGYEFFLHGEVVCDDGSRVRTGKISMGGGHATLALGAQGATDHYDSTSTAVADIVVGEDEHGVWFAGATRPTLTDEQIREFRGSAVSGDWREINHGLEMVALLSVNTPGFAVPRASLAASADADDEIPVALLSAGFIPLSEADAEDCGCDSDDGLSGREAIRREYLKTLV